MEHVAIYLMEIYFNDRGAQKCISFLRLGILLLGANDGAIVASQVLVLNKPNKQ